MTEELKPCPFCGGEAYIHEHYSFHGYSRKGQYPNYEPLGYAVGCRTLNCRGKRENTGFMYPTKAEAAETWNTRAATTIGQVAVEVVPTKSTCKLEPLEAFYVTANMLDQTEWGVCSNCGTASPIDATYCCECGRKVER